jgi:hypothetical protein
VLQRHCCLLCPPPEGVGEGEPEGARRGEEEEREVGSEERERG